MGLTGAREQFWPGALPDKVSALTLLDGWQEGRPAGKYLAPAVSKDSSLGDLLASWDPV